LEIGMMLQIMVIQFHLMLKARPTQSISLIATDEPSVITALLTQQQGIVLHQERPIKDHRYHSIHLLQPLPNVFFTHHLLGSHIMHLVSLCRLPLSLCQFFITMYSLLFSQNHLTHFSL
jgi:hypothetical protein